MAVPRKINRVLGREAWSTREYSWSWAPAAGNGLGDLVAAWVSPDEAKLTQRAGQQYLMTTASGGFVGVVPYPQGTNAYWAADVGAANNPHSIELLVLWALGTHDLVALRVGGTSAAPTITPARVIPLPSEGGHDLQPVPGAPDQLWVTTETEVLRFNKSSETFTSRYPGASAIDREDVKSVTTNARTGRVLTVALQEDHVCTWCTDTVDLAFPHEQLTLRGAWIYKARWWQPQ